MKRNYPHTVNEYLKKHKVFAIVTDTECLWEKSDGKIPNEFRYRTIKDVKGTTVVVY